MRFLLVTYCTTGSSILSHRPGTHHVETRGEFRQGATGNHPEFPTQFSANTVFSHPTLTEMNSTAIQRTNMSSKNSDQQSLELYIWAGITLPIIYLAAFGNLLSLLVIVRSRWWKSGIQVLILSMTIADLSTTFIIAPEQAINMLFGKVYPWSYQPFCRAIGYLQMGISFPVPLHCCMIAINRLVSIVLPVSFRGLSHRPVGIFMSCLCWFVPFFLLVFPLAEVDGKFGNMPLFGYCTWDGRGGTRAMSYAISVTVMYLPTAVILICYLTIFVYLKKIEHTVGDHGVGNGEAAEQRKVVRTKRRVQVAKMMLVTFLVFLICYVPLTSFFYLAGNLGKRPNPTIFLRLTFVYWLGACCNPVIYSVMNTEFREAYQEALRQARCGWRPKVGASLQPSMENLGGAHSDFTSAKRRSLKPSTKASTDSNA